MSFKLQVVEAVERGALTIGCATRKYGIQNHSTATNWLRKYGAFDWQTQTPLRQTVDIYNNVRPHFSCTLLTPAQMHRQAELPRATCHKKVRRKRERAPENININVG